MLSMQPTYICAQLAMHAYLSTRAMSRAISAKRAALSPGGARRGGASLVASSARVVHASSASGCAAAIASTRRASHSNFE